MSEILKNIGSQLEHGVGASLSIGERGSIQPGLPLGHDLHRQVDEPTLDADDAWFVGLGYGVEGVQDVIDAEEDSALVALLERALEESNNAFDGRDLRAIELRDVVLLVHDDVGHGHVCQPNVCLVRLGAPGHVHAVH